MDGAVDLNLSEGETPQKQIQALIRAEIVRHHPIKGALRPLEIIAESSVRVVENGGRARYEIIDEDGVVRAGSECGRPLTIADLVAELRTKHPSLFERASAQAAPGEHTARYEIIDEDSVVPTSTIADAVAELRTKHPSLFEIASAQAAPGEHTEPKPATNGLVEAPRDLLILSSNEPGKSESAELHLADRRVMRPWSGSGMSSLAARVA